MRYSDGFRHFKKGPFHVALNTGVTIIPVGIMGAYDSYHRHDWHLNPGIIKIKYGDPVKHEYYKDMTIEELSDDIYKRIAILCEDDKIKENKV